MLGYNSGPVTCDYPILSNKFTALITHVESANVLFIQLNKTAETLGTLLDEMFEFYEKDGIPLTTISKSCLCAAQSHDLNWYRGYVEAEEDTNDPTKCKIRYLDYGNTECVPKSNLKVLSPQFYTPSALAVKIMLPLKTKSPADTMKTIEGMTTGFNLDIEIKDFVDKCWICDVTNEGKSIIDVIGNGLVEWATVDELRPQYADDLMNRVKYMLQTTATKPADGVVAANIGKDIVEPTPVAVAPHFEGIGAQISHVDSPDRFYLVIESDIAASLKLRENIQITAPSLQNLTNIKKGVLCIAKFSHDELWYRARVLDFGDDVVTIQFIDYGNTDVITDPKGGYLKIIPEAFATVKPYAMLCSLPVHPSKSSEWCEPATKYFYEYLEKKVKFEYISREGPVKYVHLVSNETGENISKALIDMGYALQWDTIKTGEKCYVSNSVSISEFSIQLEADSLDLEILSEYMSQGDNVFVPLDPIEVGGICAAQFPEDHEWYRARILSHNPEDGKTRVLFIDFGNEATVKNVRSIEKAIAELPPLSKPCSLFMPADIVCWSEEAELLFQEIASLGLTVFVAEMYGAGERIIVNLYRDDTNILNELVPLCRKRPTIRDSMSESIMEDFLMADINQPACTSPSNEPLLMPVIVSHVNKVMDFYAQKKEELTSLNDTAMYLSVNADNLVVLEQKIVGKMCIAQFPVDKLFYRAKILSITDNGCDVFYVDYGNTYFVATVYELPDILQKIPIHANHFALQKLNIDDHIWEGGRSTKLFVEMLTRCIGRCMQVKIVNATVDPQLVVLYANELDLNSTLQMLLMDTNADDLDEVIPSTIPQPSKEMLDKIFGAEIVADVLASVDDKNEKEGNIINNIIDGIMMDMDELMMADIETEMGNAIVDAVIDTATDEINIGRDMVDDVFESCIKISENEKTVAYVLEEIVVPSSGDGNTKSIITQQSAVLRNRMTAPMKLFAPSLSEPKISHQTSSMPSSLRTSLERLDTKSTVMPKPLGDGILKSNDDNVESAVNKFAMPGAALWKSLESFGLSDEMPTSLIQKNNSKDNETNVDCEELII